jgi:alpha-L-rhamnosidase
MKLINPRVEYLINPLGLDVLKPRFSWAYAIDDESKKNEKQFSYRIYVSDSLDALKKDEANCWDSQKHDSDRSNQIEYQGSPLKSNTKYYWKVVAWDQDGNQHDSLASAGVSFFHLGILDPKEWRANWIGPESETCMKIAIKDTTKEKPVEVLQTPPAPMMRKEFICKKPVKSAILYATSLGEYEIRVNGHRVGDRYFTPEWTDYEKRVLYQSYDITPHLQKGTNAMGAYVGDGWYMGFLGPGDAVRQLYYGKNRRLLAQLMIEYEDGTTEEVFSDGSWKLWLDGPIRSSDHFMGEVFDMNKELSGWDQAGFKENSWLPVFVDNTVKIPINAQKHEPVQCFQRLKPIAITSPMPDVYIFNMGQNMVGWCEITVKGKKGQQIQLRHGEMLELDGTLHVENLRLAAQTDRYILAGEDVAKLHPHFTFHGFQYVEVTGLKSKPSLEFLEGVAVSSNPPVVGFFSCSNPMLNKMWENILWTQRDNTVSIPTDCPQRNERMGWMGDAEVFAQTAIYNMDMAAFFSKFSVDMRDGQGEEGQYPDFAPHPFQDHLVFTFGPGWADCGVITPWRLYCAYNDKRILAENYSAMKKFVDLIIDENPDFIWSHWGSNYGDWLHGDTLKAKGYPKKGGECPKNVYATFFYYLSSLLVSKSADVLGNTKDAQFYRDVAEKVSKAFVTTFIDKKGKIKGDTQSAYAIALGFGILPSELQPKAVAHLIDAIKKYKGRLSTGFISTIQMMNELSNRGYNEQAYDFIESKKFPSWGYSIEQGSTTIWERWDGYVKGRGFQNKGMNSFNHYSIGAVGEWIYSNVLGIKFDESKPGMKHIFIEPRPGGSLKNAKGTYESINGLIKVEWKKKEDASYEYLISIPPNTTATLKMGAGKAIEIGSGVYVF